MKAHDLRRFTVLLLLASLTFGKAASLNDLTYHSRTDHIVITDCDTFANGVLIIPAQIEGKAVTIIADQAFQGCRRLEAIQLPSSIILIGDCAFQGCLALTSFTLMSGVESIGSEAFWGTALNSPEQP
ncbi:MAG: hypothetical protein ACJAVK_000949 [Akkermansiaceae bacterium]|jgi:hypothetical protein